jgi:hypothetical protein
MKKGLLSIISLAFAVFILSAIALTINTVSGMQAAQTAVVENIQPAPVVEISTQVQKSPTVTTAIDMAAAISSAQADAGMATLSSPKADLVDLNGKTAYEVLFDFGKIYVDANTGLVLGNSIVVTPEIAGSVAANYLQLNRYNNVSQVSLKGENVYKVNFIQGINVYVSMKGVVVTWEYAPSNNVNPNTAPGSNQNSGSNRQENDD